MVTAKKTKKDTAKKTTRKTKKDTPPTVQQILKDKLIEQRENGVTVKEIALAAGIAPPTLTRWLSRSPSSRKCISADSVDKLAQFFNMVLREN